MEMVDDAKEDPLNESTYSETDDIRPDDSTEDPYQAYAELEAVSKKPKKKVSTQIVNLLSIFLRVWFKDVMARKCFALIGVISIGICVLSSLAT
jgi:hypothetical protein